MSLGVGFEVSEAHTISISSFSASNLEINCKFSATSSPVCLPVACLPLYSRAPHHPGNRLTFWECKQSPIRCCPLEVALVMVSLRIKIKITKAVTQRLRRSQREFRETCGGRQLLERQRVRGGAGVGGVDSEPCWELSWRHGCRAKAKDRVEPSAQFMNLSLLSVATPEVVSLPTRTVSQHSKWSQKLGRWSRPSQGTVWNWLALYAGHSPASIFIFLQLCWMNPSCIINRIINFPPVALFTSATTPIAPMLICRWERKQSDIYNLLQIR